MAKKPTAEYLRGYEFGYQACDEMMAKYDRYFAEHSCHSLEISARKREAEPFEDHLKTVEKVGTQRKYTIWTAPASQDVPALVQLDMRAPIAGVKAARKRAENAKARAKTALGYYERSTRPVRRAIQTSACARMSLCGSETRYC